MLTECVASSRGLGVVKQLCTKAFHWAESFDGIFDTSQPKIMNEMELYSISFCCLAADRWFSTDTYASDYPHFHFHIQYDICVHRNSNSHRVLNRKFARTIRNGLRINL